jgi:hypothetical protein
MTQSILSHRRHFLTRSGQAVLSGTAIALLAGGVHAENVIRDGAGKALRVGSDAAAGDVSILNVALGLEHEAINAYQLGAGSGLLQKGVLEVAVLFQSHHKAHRDALIATIEKMGGRPVQERTLAEYAAALKADTLKSQGDVLALAMRLEQGASNAYLGVIPAFKTSALGQVAARLAADEVMHYTALAGALGRALPSGALSFGA